MKARISRLYAWGPKLEQTLEEILAGKLSFSTHLPIRVSRLDDPRGGLFILDGHHRAIEAGIAGKVDLPADLDLLMPRIERTGGAHREILMGKISVQAFVDRFLFERLAAGGAPGHAGSPGRRRR